MSQGVQGQQQGNPPTSTLAIVALVMSFLCMPIGLVLAIVALVRINKSKGALGGKTLAIIALVLNLVLVPMCGGVYAAIAIPNFIKFQCRSKQSEAKANLKSLFVAQEMYRSEKDGYTTDLGALQFAPQGQVVRYDYAVVEAGPQGFRAEARGKGDMEGDLWVITNANDLRNERNTCTPGAEAP